MTSKDYTEKKRFTQYLQNHKASVGELSVKFRVTKKEILEKLKALRESGVEVISNASHKNSRDYFYHVNVLPDRGNIFHLSGPDRRNRTIKYAASSDWHFASKFFLEKSWHEAMKRVEGMGIKRVYVAGDLVDGTRIYKGHLENLTCFGVEDQTDVAAEAISKHPNLEFWAIAGNHDYSFTQQNGTKPMAALESKLDNFKNLGDFRADVIYKGVRFRLLHGGTGRAYAKSYPSQTYLRHYFSGLDHHELKEAPKVMILGHFHTLYNGFDHGMHILQPGSFQDSDNEFCIRRGLTGPTGLYAISMQVQNGEIHEFDTRYITPKIARKEKGKMHSMNTRNYHRPRK